MFLMIGVTDGQKALPYHQTGGRPRCGQFTAYEEWMTYTQLLLFFIPCFKWHRQYFVRMRCCGAVYALDPEVGRRIARGEDVTIRPEDLHEMVGSDGGGFRRGPRHRCAFCGYETDEDFAYCPKCGRRFED